MVKRNTLLLFALAAIILAGGIVSMRALALPAFAPIEQKVQTVYVLDAGHGGEDGGAVSADGVKESDINLAIAFNLDALLQLIGRETVMIRTEDVSLHSDGAETLRQKKVSDLKNRVALTNATPGAVLVSIHQNSLPTVPSVHGAQVFYGKIEPGAALADLVQDSLNRSVNAGNEKNEKAIDPSIYLIKHVQCPAILVECGFLSNDAEAIRLLKPEYQKTLALAIAAGLINADTNDMEREEP